MKNANFINKFVLFAFIPALLFLACEQPFKAGLGPLVDIRPPTVTLESPTVGEVIWGEANLFTGSADDDYKLDKVEFMVTNYPDDRNPFREFTLVNGDVYGKNKASWNIVVDTTLFTNEFGDGDLKVRLKVTDSVGKITITDEYLFVIVNEPPSITLTGPYVNQGVGDGNIDIMPNGGRLNWGMAGEGEPFSSSTFPRKMDSGSSINGTISHRSYGMPPHIPGSEWQPGIRIWRVVEELSGIDDQYREYLPGVVPPESEIGWTPFNRGANPNDDNYLSRLGVDSYMFGIKVPGFEGAWFGLQIRAQSQDGRSSFYYPGGFYSGDRATPENSYVLFYLKTAGAFPTVSLYENMENLSDFDSSATPKYYKLYTDNTNYNPDDYECTIDGVKVNTIVDEVDAYKNGDFILRYRTAHQDDILSAEVYWESSNNTRGRFIWDPATDVTGTDANNHISKKYSQWGTESPLGRANANDPEDKTRNFVFSYRPGARVNNNAHAAVRGRTTVQLYTGSEVWESVKQSGSWADTAEGWTDMTDGLPEGTYKIEVYARGSYFSGRVNYPPYKNTVRLDTGRPTVRITDIKGAFSRNLNADPPTAIVNGVIEPEVSIADSRPQDSGLRMAAGTTASPYGNTYEQRWVLVNDNNRTAVRNLFTSSRTYWPPVGALANALNLNSVQTVKHGVVVSGVLRFKTSPIYSSETATSGTGKGPGDALVDGTYWLFVFARDEAYNVGWSETEIVINKNSDYPVITALGEINADVTTPNKTDTAPTPTGTPVVRFENGNSYRNWLTPGSNIRLQLSDDDMLKLAGNAPTVKIVAAKAATGNTGDGIEALAETTYEASVNASNIFGTVNTKATPITIQQSALVSAIKDTTQTSYNTWGLFAPKGSASEYTDTLPDGVYRLRIHVGDNPPDKLKMTNDFGAVDATDPEEANKDIDIWLFVDTTIPDITGVKSVTAAGTVGTEGWIDPTDGISNGTHGVRITGMVADANGPISVKTFTITNEAGGTAPTQYWVTLSEVAFTRITTVQTAPDPATPYPERMFYANFVAPVHITPNISTTGFNVTLELQDRFGRSRVITQKYQMDTEPPKVNITPIEDFERKDNDRVKITTAGDISTTYQEHLVNGVVSFRINATDNRSIKDVRYWLIPWTGSGPTWGEPTFSGWDESGYKSSLNNDFSSSSTIFIDTATLNDNTPYSLFVMAEDSASLKSQSITGTSPNHRFQTVFVRQNEDAPYFEKTGSFALGGGAEVVDKSGMTLSLTVTDDDGFYQDTGIRPGMFKIWFSPDSSDDLSEDLGSLNATTGAWTAGAQFATHFGTAYTPAIDHAGVTIFAQNSKTVTLNFDLSRVTDASHPSGFYTGLQTDGPKHFIIEAEDSHQSKYYNNSGTWTTPAPDTTTYRRVWRQYVSMVADTNDPIVTITAPADSSDPAIVPVFGSTTSTFDVTGSLFDLFLKRIPMTTVGDYYFTLKLDGNDVLSSGAPEFKLGATTGGFITSLVTTGSDNTTVYFTIPSSTFTGWINYSSLSHGRHNLMFTAEDRSNKKGSATISFIRDIKPPEWRFASGFNDNKTEIPTINNRTWWNATTNPADYTAKRGTTLPTVSYEADTTDVPSITGTFSDDFANIDTAKFKVKFDNGTEITIPSTQITGTGKNVNWEVFLTQNGTNVVTTLNSILTDGVHTIQISISDDVGNETTTEDYNRMYGFRLISETPKSKFTELRRGNNTPPAAFENIATVQNVFGDRATTSNNTNAVTNVVFTIRGEAEGKNLAAFAANTGRPVELIIRYTDTVAGKAFTDHKFTPPSGTWTYTLLGGTNAPPTGTGKEEITEKYTWEFAVPRSAILNAGHATGDPDPLAVGEKMRAGNYEIVAVAYDRSTPNARYSEETAQNVWKFVIDSTPPEFSFQVMWFDTTGTSPAVGDNTTTPPAAWAEGANVNTRNVITDPANPSIKGRVTDNNELLNVELQISKWNYTATNQTANQPATNGAWQLYDGANWTNWTATLAANDTYWITLTPPINDLSSWPVDWALTGFEDGYYRVRLRARDASISSGGTTGWGTDNNGNPAYSHFMFFFLDREPPEVTPDESDTGFFSSQTTPAMPFGVNVSDLNRIESIVATFTADGTTPPANMPGPAILAPNITTLRYGAMLRTVTATITDPYNGTSITSYLPDGSYKVNFVVTDLAGRTTTKNRTIKIDNQPPIVAITEPREAATGGEDFTVIGSTSDLGDNGSASGVSPGNANAGIWYHIGYGTQPAASLAAIPALPALPTPTQRKARSDAIKAWVLNTGSTITADNGASSNANFNTASRGGTATAIRNSLWFRYTTAIAGTGTNTDYIVPTGFEAITSAQAENLLNWYLNANSTTVNVVSSYSIGSVSIRGLTYNTSSARRLALPSDDPSGRSTHSLPIVVRVADNAGNVSYELYDIRLDPYGDNPKTVINNTQDRFMGESQARGGQIQINGIAKDNIGVRRVIYRVKADNVRNTAAGNAPADTAIITIPNKTQIATTSWDLPSPSPTTFFGGGQTDHTGAALSKTGWYDATVESPGSTTSAWNFMLNESGEIRDAIAARGFNHSGGTGNDMIRVWIEVMVFDQTLAGLNNLMSLGDTIVNGGTTVPIDAARPRPYIREFYFTATAPEITDKQISALGRDTFGPPAITGTFVPYTSQLAENNVRSGKFAIRAKLDSKTHIGMIRVRLLDEPVPGDNEWKTLVSGSTMTLPAGVTLRDGTDTATFIASASNPQAATLYYQFETAASAAFDFQSVRSGAWAQSGGTYRIVVEVTDTGEGGPAASDSYIFEVGIDNFVPLADEVKNITNKKVAGSNVTFQGRAFDFIKSAGSDATPAFKGIQEVRVWFTNRTGNSYINMDTGASIATGSVTQASMNVYSGRKATDIGWDGDSVGSIGVQSPGSSGAFSYPNQINYFKSLTASQGPGITWAPNINDGSDISWMFTQDTTKFADGWIKLHYIVIDKAGNASYYAQDMIVMNKVPMINKITLYTNNIGSGAVFTTHEGAEAFSEYVLPFGNDGKTVPYEDGYLNSGFISKNRVIGFGIDTEFPGGGNPNFTYTARFVERYRVPLSSANLTVMANRSGNLSYVDDAGGNASEAITEFENLYTIPGGMSRNLNADGWRLLGVQRATPVDGAHFVFLAAAADLTGMNEPNVFVYAYKYVGGTGGSSAGVVKTLSNLDLASAIHIAPAQLNFASGTDYFNNTTTTIREAQAKTSNNATAPPPGANDAQRDAASQGTAFFLIKVTDTVDHNEDRAGSGITEKDMLFDAVVIGMKVFVGDRRSPFARLYDLNPYMEKAVVGANNGVPNQKATREDAVDPIEIGKNVRRGSLYNLGTERDPIKSGYIDPRANSTALNPLINYPSDPINPYARDVNGNWESTSLSGRADGFVANDTVAGGPAHDKVSGTVILRGLAWDDQLINTISIKIGGDDLKTILTLRYVQLSDMSIVTNPSALELQTGAVVRKLMPESGVEAWTTETIHWQTGHTVEWAYLWNTEKEPAGTPARIRGGPVPDTDVSVVVTDLNGSLSNSEVLTDTPAVTAGPNGTQILPNFRNKITVDIAPYITGFKRDEDRFLTTRSRQGWYSFYRGEDKIKVVGYNLGNNPTTTVVNLNSANDALGVGGTALGGRAFATNDPVLNHNLPNEGHTFTMNSDASSGRIDVYVGGTAVTSRAWNHQSTHTNKSWNKETGVTGSDLWINKPHAHIWRTAQDLGAPATLFGNNTADGGSINADSPSMGLEYAPGTAMANQGRLHGSWGIMSNFGVYYGINANAARTTLLTANDPLLLTDFDYYPSNVSPNRNRTMISVYEWDGQPQVAINSNMQTRAHVTGDISATGGGRLTPTMTGQSTTKWGSPRVRMVAPHTSDADATVVKIYTSMYDRMNESLYFVARGVENYSSSDPPTSTQDNQTQVYVDGTSAGSGGTYAASAGEWNAIDYTGSGANARPIIAYYDGTNDTLRLAYGNGQNGGTWTRRYVFGSGTNNTTLDTSNALAKGSGKYVSMRVVGDDIHLAFYNSTYNTVVYAVGTRTGAFTAYTVDNVIKGGIWTDIAVDADGNPWITYGDLGRIGPDGDNSAGNYDGVRIAYKTSGAGAFTRALNDPIDAARSITGWEAVTMPADYKIPGDRLNIEAWPPAIRAGQTGTVSGVGGGWNAAVGYLGTDASSVRQFRVGYFYKPAATVVTRFQTTGN